jgi:hypothetical protein
MGLILPHARQMNSEWWVEIGLWLFLNHEIKGLETEIV